MGSAEILFKRLKLVTKNVLSVKEDIERLNVTITELKTDFSFDNFLRETNQSTANLAKRKSLESSSSRIHDIVHVDLRCQYFEICDDLDQHINMRFELYPCFVGLLDSHRFVCYSSSITAGLLDGLMASPCGKLFNGNELPGELQLLYRDNALSQIPNRYLAHR